MLDYLLSHYFDILYIVCNYFERAYKEYETRIRDSRRSISILNAPFEGEEVKIAQQGTAPSFTAPLDMAVPCDAVFLKTT